MEKSKRKFDVVAMMREIRDRMSQDIEGMHYEEQKRYLLDRPQIRRSQAHVTKSKKNL